MYINEDFGYDFQYKNENKIFSKQNTKTNIDKGKEKKEDLKNALTKLDNLIGLDKIKVMVREYIAFVKIQILRESYGLKKLPIASHMIFKGNPGTGKTTVARLIAEIFKSLGYLNKGQFIEAERADLVGEYIGHTAKKTKSLIKEAIGGVLFIDEAYSLARGGEKDFGKESIDTLVKAMEDYKDNLIIIMAGYKTEMENFLKTNPGLKSRFALHLNFEDYSTDELFKIALLMIEEREYKLMERNKKYLYNFISILRNDKNNNGNARMIRNFIEKIIRTQASRLIKKDNINKNDLLLIKNDDLINAFKQEI